MTKCAFTKTQIVVSDNGSTRRDRPARAAAVRRSAKAQPAEKARILFHQHSAIPSAQAATLYIDRSQRHAATDWLYRRIGNYRF